MAKFEPGDRIRFNRLTADGFRINGALDLTVKFYGTKTVVYEYKNPTSGRRGESTCTREEFDRDYELVPEAVEVDGEPDEPEAAEGQTVEALARRVEVLSNKIDALAMRGMADSKRLTEFVAEYHTHKHMGSGPGTHG